MLTRRVEIAYIVVMPEEPQLQPQLKPHPTPERDSEGNKSAHEEEEEGVPLPFFEFGVTGIDVVRNAGDPEFLFDTDTEGKPQKDKTDVDVDVSAPTQHFVPV